MKSIIPNIGFLLIPTAVCAEFNDETLAFLGSENLFLEEMPIVISATRLAQPLNESPIATTVIDRQMINASGAQTIADILRLVPGYTVGYISGNTPVAAYHGHSDRYSRRIQLVIDGRSVYLPTLSGVSWSDLVITLDEIERIEVVRGPNASTYGNNAFLSVVSITTRHAAEEEGHYVKNTVGSHDTSDVIYRFGGNTEDLDYRVTVGTKNNEGTDMLDDFTATDYFGFRLDYQLNTSTHLFYQGGIQDSIYGDLIENATDTANDVDVTTAFQHIKLEHSFADESSLSIQYYYNFTKSFDSNFLTSVSFATASVGTPFEALFADIDDFDTYDTIALESDRHDLELTYHYTPLDSLRLVSGTSVRADRVRASNVFDPGVDNQLILYRAFTHGEYSFNDNWILNAGIMLENNDISGTDTAPRLALIHHFNEQHSFRISGSRATRTPTIFDEFGYLAIDQTLTQNNQQPLDNPPLEAALGGDSLVDVFIFSPGGLESERVSSIELGWMMTLLDNKLTLDIKLFQDRTYQLISEISQQADIPLENIDDLNTALGIPIDPADPAYIADIVIGDPGAKYEDNAAKTKTHGLEFYTDYQISQSIRLYTFFSYTEIDAEKSNANASDSIVGRLEESTPRRSYGAMLMKQWENNLNTSMAVYHVADMDWMDRTHNRETPVGNEHKDRSAEAYTRLDFVLRKLYTSGNSQLEYSFILQNVLGSHYDYTRTSYTDPTLETINVPGSEQDPRGYFELAFKFN